MKLSTLKADPILEDGWRRELDDDEALRLILPLLLLRVCFYDNCLAFHGCYKTGLTAGVVCQFQHNRLKFIEPAMLCTSYKGIRRGLYLRVSHPCHFLGSEFILGKAYDR